MTTGFEIMTDEVVELEYESLELLLATLDVDQSVRDSMLFALGKVMDVLDVRWDKVYEESLSESLSGNVYIGLKL
jgi:hypothetical protein